MGAFPAKFLSGFLFVSVLLWIVFMFVFKLLAWILGRVMGASFRFKIGGWICLRDVVLKFNRGAVESISVGEIRLSLRQSLVKLGVGFMSRDPKLQVLICDLEIVTRSSKKSPHKTRSKKSRNSGRAKGMGLANMARFLSVSISALVIKTPKATLEIKEIRVNISKDGGSKAGLFLKLHLFPITVHLGESCRASDHPVISDGSSSANQLADGDSPHFRCEEFFLLCEVGHSREAGVLIRNLDITCGEVRVNLTEDLLLKEKSLAEKPADLPQKVVPANNDSEPDKQQARETVSVGCKFSSIIPEKAAFTLPELDVKIGHRGYGLVVENNIRGIQLKCMKSQSIEDVGESLRLDVQMEFSEIFLLRETGISVVEILQLDIVSSIYMPLQPNFPIRSEIDVKLGSTQCNLILNRLEPWMSIRLPEKNKKETVQKSPNKEKPHSSEHKRIVWTCTLSVPEITVVLYSLTGCPVYHGSLQSSHIFANNVSSTGATLHIELGELNLEMSDEYQECLKERLFGVDTSTGSLMHVAKVSLDLGKKEMDSSSDGLNHRMVLVADVSSMGVYLTFRRVESLISTALSLKDLMKKLSKFKKKPTQSKGMRSSRPSGKGIQLLRLSLGRCSLNISADASLDDVVIPDPKRVNYGSQGGRVLISTSADGSPRTAHIMSTISNECKMKYSASLDIYHFSVSLNKEKKSMQMELERARSIYQEFPEDNNNPGAKVTLLDMQKAKLVKRSSGLNESQVCSLFSAADISLRWEPDVHIALLELGLHLKSMVQTHKPQGNGESIYTRKDKESNMAPDSLKFEKPMKKSESIFAVDVEMLNISAEVGDGVEAFVQVQSIFSENAKIGVLLEELIIELNEARVFKSTRMQLSRVPNTSGSSSDAKFETITTWDWLIRALDVHICLPYRLELRAIDDSLEEMLRVLKLVSSAKARSLLPQKKEPPKPKKPSSTRTGCIKVCLRKLTADIEEEPLQGWLDEHYQLLKTEARELAVRLDLLEELISKGQDHGGTDESGDSPERKIHYNEEEIDLRDAAAIQKLREEIYKKSFQSYYQACQSLVPSEGSGACKNGFQAGFRPSTARNSLFSISASKLDLSLSKIEGGDAGMIEVLQKLDPVCRVHNIPFSRLYGANINLHVGSLVAQIRNYSYPLLAATGGRCEGRLILAQQATCFQPQIHQEVYIGRWRKVDILRSASGTTPPMKTFCDLPIHFQKGEISFGIGYEPPLTDISYAFTVALRRANLSIRNPNPPVQPPKKEKSLPWWDEMRNYVHGNTTLYFSETSWNVLATTDPYETLDRLEIISGYFEIQQSDGRIYASIKDFKVFPTSLQSLEKTCTWKRSCGFSDPFLVVPALTAEVTMEWDCESGSPLNHYLFALPIEGVPRDKLFDPFRSIGLSIRFNVSLGPLLPSDSDDGGSCNQENNALSCNSPIVHLGHHDLAWLLKFWNLNYLPPHKLRTFSRWPRFGVPRIPRSGNLSLDKVITEFMFRVEANPTCIKHIPLLDDDPAKGLTYKMTKVKYEMYFGRGKNKFTFEEFRDPLDIVYQGIDLHMLNAYINKEDCASVAKSVQMTRKKSQTASTERATVEKTNSPRNPTERHQDDGFLLSSDCFTIRRQHPKADPARLLEWQEDGRRNLEMAYLRSEFENENESDDHTRSELTDDDGDNVVISDNCQRISVYGLKLLWTLENRDAVCSWVRGITKAFEPPKPSPSRQYAQRKMLEENTISDEPDTQKIDSQKSPSAAADGTNTSSQNIETSTSLSSPSNSETTEIPFSSAIAKYNFDDSEEEGTRHFMVNVIEPQFNLHSEEANGRFLLAAASGRVLARSFHTVLHVEMIEKALGEGKIQVPESQPEMTWNRSEFSVMLEHVQAHVAPTDVDPGAGVQWLPKIRRSSPKVKRTGALLEQVFMPCDMYFRYRRHNGGTPDVKVKPLKELGFNSDNITAAMTSRQFQVMVDVLNNLLFARLPKPRKNSLSYPTDDDDEDVEEEADEVVPDGVEEVELAKVDLEHKERMKRLIIDDIASLSLRADTSEDANPEMEMNLWMITCGSSTLVQRLKKELVTAQKSRKAASASLRTTMQKAAELRLMEKDKNKSPSYAMRVSLQIHKVVWSMLLDGKPFSEAEINHLIYDFDRDYKDIGVAKFTTKYFVLRNGLKDAKSDTLLCAWNPPTDWGKKVMLRVDAKQGFSKEGKSPIELFQVEIYPLKIHLTESMYRMIWRYLFPEEEQDCQRRQEVWKVSTTAGARRGKKGSIIQDASDVKATGSNPELRRSSSFDRTWEENVAESVANELVMQMHSSTKGSSISGPEQPDETSKGKSKDTKGAKTGQKATKAQDDKKTQPEEKKATKTQDDKKTQPRRLREFHNIKISQVELLVTYEGSRFAVSDLRLLMDTFHRAEFTGTWKRLFSRVKKHIIWGVLKSVTGMQGKKFKDKASPSIVNIPDSEGHLNDSDAEKGDQNPMKQQHPADGAGDGFVTSIKGLFSNKRKKAKAFVLKTMRGEGENEIHGEWSEGEAEFSPLARQMTATKAKKLIRRHTKKFNSKKGLTLSQSESPPASPRDGEPFDMSDSDSSSDSSSTYDEFLLTHSQQLKEAS